MSAGSDRRVPTLFGSAQVQELLREIAEVGHVNVTNKNRSKLARLANAGICTFRDETPKVAFLSPSYPAAQELRAVLQDLLGHPIDDFSGKSNGIIHNDKPLAHRGPVSFHILFTIMSADEPLDEETLKRRMPYHWPERIMADLAHFVEDGVLVKGEGGGYELSPAVPASFKTLVLRLADIVDDPRLVESNATGKRTWANQHAEDGAPLLFGTDIRLRNFIALAVHGPMMLRDLRKLTGVNHLRKERFDDAPFGRGGIVRTWETPDGTACALDVDYPLHPPLLRLLRKLAEVYPPAPGIAQFGTPEMPEGGLWHGDRHVLFGSSIPTSILLSLGVFGWTFEALCVKVATGHHRENVKKAMKRLEDEGVLQGDRPRKSGFSVRVVTIADAFPARDELTALIEAYIEVWPGPRTDVNLAMQQLSSRTKAQLRRRGLFMLQYA